MSDEDHHLATGSIGAIESFVMAIGGTAPAFSIAVASAAIIGDVGTLSIASIIYCGIIMFGLVIAFSNLNKVNPNAGASYTWVSTIFSPFLGFVAGWSMLLSSAIFMVAATVPAATSTLMIFASDYANDTFAVTFVGAFWLSLITFVVIKGTKFAYLLQLIMLIAEIIIITVIVIASLTIFFNQPMHTPELGWLSPFSFSLKSFASSATTALFFYWGWDVTMSLGEETRKGKAEIGALYSITGLILFFSLMIFVVLITLTDEEIFRSNSNILFALAEKIFPSPWSYIAIICTMLSTIGTIEGQILQFSRCVFAMSRDNILPHYLSVIHSKWQTPWAATLVMWALGIIFLFCSSFLPSVNAILKASISAIGLQICLYMSMTAIASAWHYRHKIHENISSAVYYVLWPLFGALSMIAIGVVSLLSTDLNATLLGLGGIAIGVMIYVVRNRLSLSSS